MPVAAKLRSSGGTDLRVIPNKPSVVVSDVRPSRIPMRNPGQNRLIGVARKLSNDTSRPREPVLKPESSRGRIRHPGKLLEAGKGHGRPPDRRASMRVCERAANRRSHPNCKAGNDGEDKTQAKEKSYKTIVYNKGGGGSGIRTHDTVSPYTRFPSVRLQPLGHPSTDRDNAEARLRLQPDRRLVCRAFASEFSRDLTVNWLRGHNDLGNRTDVT